MTIERMILHDDEEKEPFSFAEYAINGLRAVCFVFFFLLFGWAILLLYGMGRLAEKCGLPPERGW